MYRTGIILLGAGAKCFYILELLETACGPFYSLCFRQNNTWPGLLQQLISHITHVHLWISLSVFMLGTSLQVCVLLFTPKTFFLRTSQELSFVLHLLVWILSFLGGYCWTKQVQIPGVRNRCAPVPDECCLWSVVLLQWQTMVHSCACLLYCK